MNNKILFIILFLTIFSFTSSSQSRIKVIEYNTFITVKKGNLIEEKSFLIQINDKQSDWISDIEIKYDKTTKLEILEASIVNSQGETVRTLKKKEIITKSDISHGTFFEDGLVKEFKLKWNEYPYRIKYSYRKSSDKFMYITRWTPLIYTSISTDKATLKIELPHNFKATLEYSKEFSYKTDTLNKNIKHYWEIYNTNSIKNELFSKPYWEQIPHVTVIPLEFNYGNKGMFKTWNTYGAWQTQLNEGLDILPHSEKIIIDKLIEGLNNQNEIIKKLYHYLQDNTRYINVSIDIGGLKSYPASYVCTNKYGDCKALTMYMKALLNYVRIPSFYVKIYAGSNPVRINKNLPSQQFNHVILCIPYKKDTIWLENTANYLPYNYLGTFTQNRFALLVNGEKSKLIKTPSLQLKDVLEQNFYDFHLNQEGCGTTTMQKELQGESFENYKYIDYYYSESDQKEELKESLELKNHEIINWKLLQADRDEKKINIDIKLTADKQFRKIGDIIILEHVPLKTFNFEDPAIRETPVRINYPVNKKDSIVYNLPFATQFEIELPNNKEIESEYGKYFENYKQINDKIIITRGFQLFNNDYSILKYKSFFSFIEKIKKYQLKSTIILKPIL